VSLLLDTHVILWWLTDDSTLGPEITARLDDDPAVVISPVSIWEVTIKQSLGKLTGPATLAEDMANSGFGMLPVSAEHAIVAGRLPLLHRDPFDRMLVAQARCEGLTLATRDPLVHAYDVDTLAV
jgi:PIN domain nuclease of toxin-antitoxin system